MATELTDTCICGRPAPATTGLCEVHAEWTFDPDRGWVSPTGDTLRWRRSISKWGWMHRYTDGWQALAVRLARAGFIVADPNPFPPLRVWRWWPAREWPVARRYFDRYEVDESPAEDDPTADWWCERCQTDDHDTDMTVCPSVPVPESMVRLVEEGKVPKLDPSLVPAWARETVDPDRRFVSGSIAPESRTMEIEYTGGRADLGDTLFDGIVDLFESVGLRIEGASDGPTKVEPT